MANGAPAEHRGFGSGRAGPRTVLLVAWPSADRALLLPMIDRGELPNVARMVEQGACGPLVPLPPPVALSSWTSMVTGHPAHVHGVVHEFELGTDMQIRASSVGSSACATVWDATRRAGASAVAIGWHEEHFPRGVGRGSTEVEGAAQALVPQAGEAGEAHAPWIDIVRDAVADSLSCCTQACEALRDGAASLVAVRFRGLGVLVREFARFDPPAPHWVDAERARLLGQVMRQALRLHDALLGRMLTAGGARVRVMLASETGCDLEAFRVHPDRSVERPARPGIVLVAGPGVRRDALVHGAMVPAVAPTVLACMGLPEALRAGFAPIEVLEEAESVGAFEGERGGVRDRASRPTDGLAGPSERALPEGARRILRERACNVARSWMVAENWSEALHAIDAAPGDPDILSRALRARCLLALGRFDQARDALTAWRADERPPSRALSVLEAALLMRQSRPAEALECLQEALARHGESAELLVDSAEALCVLRRHDDAVVACERAIALDSTSHAAQAMLARCHFEAGRFGAAAGQCRRALALRWWDPAMHFLHGTALAADERPHEAVEALLQAVRLRPDFPAALRRLAAVHIRQLGRHGAAEGFLQMAIEAERRLRVREGANRDPA